MKPSIYIAGAGKHTGKTLVCVGLLATLREKGIKVAYMKPVGQHAIPFRNALVDEDVVLMTQVFDLPVAPHLASPVTIPRGYTTEFLSEGHSSEELVGKIRDCFEAVSADAELVVVEGTGHAGVGAVIGLSNARVASLLKSRAVIVTGGGIGRPLDEFELNRALFEERQVPVLGMISNKVREQRLVELSGLLPKWLNVNGYSLLGLIPYEPVLADITLAQIAEEIGARVLSGGEALQRTMRHLLIGAGPCIRVMGELEEGVLLITPGDRDDLVVGAISWDQAYPGDISKGIGVCVTSGIVPQEEVLSVASQARTPIITATESACEVGTAIRSLVAKILPDDETKIQAAQQLIARHVDVDGLLAAVGVG